MRCPAVKRLMREAAELCNPENEYAAHPTEANLFEWHFTIRGPESSEFENGVYHGRIIFPSQYPMKPPSFILLTPNGRFQTEEKICLSISNYHPETWLPSWSIRTALVALRSFMTTPGNEGAIGSVNFSPEERRKLANKSRSWECRDCGPIIKLLPLQQEVQQDETKSAKDTTDSAAAASKSCSQEETKNEAKITKDSNNKEDCSTKNQKVGTTTTPATSNINSNTDSDNQSAATSSALAAETVNAAAAVLQQQQNEPVKNIVYDFGIACFVVLILALCLRRLLAIFHTL